MSDLFSNWEDDGEGGILCRPTRPAPTWRMFMIENGPVYFNDWGWHFENHTLNVNAYYYMDWLFSRIAKRRYISPKQRDKLWGQACDKYRYNGPKSPHRDRGHYFHKYNDDDAVGAEHVDRPVTILNIDLTPSSRCRFCMSPLCANTWFMHEGTERLYKQGASDCTCRPVAEWYFRMGREVREAKKLGITIIPKEFKDGLPLVGYVDFVARLIAARKKRRGSAA